MTPKPILPKHLRKEISSHNKAQFEEYQAEAKDPSGYYPNVREFLEFSAYKNGKDISDINRTDIDSYISTLKSYDAKTNTINRRLSAISGFRNFLHSKCPDIFDDNFLSDLPGHERPDKNPTDIQALSLEQLCYARKYNRRSIKDEYIFELFFQLGIDKNDLIAGNFPETQNTRIKEIVKRMPKNDVADGTINSYFTRITKYLKKQDVYDKGRRKINKYDLDESHKAYFLRCPNCGESFENIAKYWVLARVNFGKTNYQDEYRIVCAQCKGASTK